MNKLFKSIVAASVGAAMTIGVGVGLGREAKAAYAAGISSDYTLLTTSNLSSLSTSDKVVIVANISGNATGVTGYSGSDATVSTTSANWKEFAVTSVDAVNGTYSLKDEASSKWISLNASNKFTIASNSETDLNADASGYFRYTDSNNDERYLAKNGSYYRCYKGNNTSGYVYFYVYKAPSGGSEQTFTVTYNNNGGSGTITDSGSPYKSGAVVTVKDAYGFTAPEGKVFDKWNTSQNGSGTSYNFGSSFSISGDTTLYAQWKNQPTDHSVTISYTDTSTTTNMTGDNDAATLGVNSADWSVKGYKNENTNFPGLNKAKQIRLYGSNYLCVKALSGNRSISAIYLSTGNANTFSVYSGDQVTSGTALVGSNGLYTFGDDTKGFTIINTGTVQVYIYSIQVFYEDSDIIVPATSVEINTHSSNLFVGQTETISATVLPSNTTDTLGWSSSLPNVASIDADGSIHALAEGDTLITATAGSYSDSYTLHVEKMKASDVNAAGLQVNVVGKVVAIAEKEAVIDDGTAALWVYSSSGLSANVGDIVKVTGTSKIYNGAIEVDSAVLTSVSDSITELTAQTITEDEIADYVDAYTGTTATLPHTKVSLQTGVVSESGNFLVWEYGESHMETHISKSIMESGSQYNIEGYLTKYYHNNTSGVTYVCIAVVSASKVGGNDSPADYLSSASTYATIHGRESATTVNFVSSEQGYSNGEAVSSASIDDVVSFSCSKGSGSTAPAYYNTGLGLRLYAGNTMTIVAAGSAKIVRIEFTVGSGSSPIGNLGASVGNLDGSAWDGDASSITFTNNGAKDNVRLSSIKVIYYTGTYSVDNVSIRFGASISKANWNAIHQANEDWVIEDYGVMMLKKATLQGYGKATVEEAYKANKNVNIIRKVKDQTTPYADPYGPDNIYSFTARVSFSNVSDYDDLIVASPFVVVSGEYYFLGDEDLEFSVNTLAAEYVADSNYNGGSSLSNKALTYLSTTH